MMLRIKSKRFILFAVCFYARSLDLEVIVGPEFQKPVFGVVAPVGRLVFDDAVLARVVVDVRGDELVPLPYPGNA